MEQEGREKGWGALSLATYWGFSLSSTPTHSSYEGGGAIRGKKERITSIPIQLEAAAERMHLLGRAVVCVFVVRNFFQPLLRDL